MRNFTRSQQGETMDAVAYRVYGKTQGITEQLLTLNTELHSHTVLPTGSIVKLLLPNEMPQTKIKTMLQLWN